MDTKSYLEILTNDSLNPCCFSDIETGEVIFLNRAMIKLINAYGTHSTEDCYQLIYDKTVPCNFTPKQNLEYGKFLEHYIFNEVFQKNYLVNNTLIEHNGRKMNFCKYSIKPVYANDQLSFEEAMAETTEILSKEKIEDVINAFLALLGQFYQCQKAFIFHGNLQDGKLEKTNAWSANATTFTLDTVDDPLFLQTLEDLYEKSMRNGVIEISTVGKRTRGKGKEFEFFSKYHLTDLVLCPIELNRELVGFVCICNRLELGSDYRLFKAITRFIEESLGRANAMSTIKQVSESDALTGLFRRKKYAEDLVALEKNPPKSLAVVFANINGLRKLNEVQGFAKGDALIARSAKCYQEFFPEPSYRISGDEFLTFLPDIPEGEFLQRMELMQKSLADSGEQLFAVGYAWKEKTRDFTRMVTEAETHMYINNQEYYKTAHASSGTVSNDVLGELLTGLEKNEFTVYLQPQFRLADESVMGAEALIRRFSSETGKMIFPDEFIPNYEQNSIIRHVDLFVVERVCQLMSQWRSHGKVLPISVNLSRVTLLEYNIPHIIAEICDKYEIPHELIVIEVTERVGLIENNVASSLIQQFMSLGFKISLDDFGCAYSNIVTLVKISVDEIKIDKSLVDDILTSEKNQIIVGNLLNMCNSFQNTSTLAEGIEYPEQAEILREYGCTYGQGYYFSRPIPAEEFQEKYIQGNL